MLKIIYKTLTSSQMIEAHIQSQAVLWQRQPISSERSSEISPASPISEYNPPKQTVLASLYYYIVRMMLRLRIQWQLLIREVCVWRAEAIAPYIM